ncbi:unnamed protein product [Prorocentrum cordatum]|uniref:Uncharacterized protein n=1 Tax=Prorocentrum cordatum TaxID=2364126 RepID=A0ABN9T3N5_9DINO|nr:unnamed protein product [Polarella glacialis]
MAGRGRRGRSAPARTDLVEWVSGVASLQEVAALQELRRWMEATQEIGKNVSGLLERGAGTPLLSTPLTSGWTRCASENELCQCPSKVVRFGDPVAQRWTEALSPRPTGPDSFCTRAAFREDPAPFQLKVCQCWKPSPTCPDGSPLDVSKCPGYGGYAHACLAGCQGSQGGTAPSEPGGEEGRLCSGGRAQELLWSCDLARGPSEGRPGARAEGVLEKATQEICKDRFPKFRNLLEVRLDCEFARQYETWVVQGPAGFGWLEAAYVTYVAGKKDSKYEWQATNLARSVDIFSERPLVVVVFDDEFVPPAEWHEMPNVIVYKMLPEPDTVSFNFNKLRAMVGARAVLGVELDTDQIVFAGIDQMFNSTAREVTERHPWPIMPVHWMSRDDHEGNPYRVYAFRGYNGTHTMRWGHAHPTWSFWALPFLLDTLLERLLATEGPNISFMAWRLPEARAHGLPALLEQGSLAKSARQVVPAVWMQEKTRTC